MSVKEQDITYWFNEKRAVQAGPLLLDFANRLVKTPGKGIVHFTKSEFSLVCALKPGHLRSTTELLELYTFLRHPERFQEPVGVSSPYTKDKKNLVNVLVQEVREKIEEDPRDPKIILSKPGHGFMLVDSLEVESVAEESLNDLQSCEPQYDLETSLVLD